MSTGRPEHRRHRRHRRHPRHRHARRFLGVRTGVLALAALAAGCGGGIQVTSVATTTTAPGGTTLTVERSPVGPILATGDGHTLYDFAIDSPTKSRCTSSACVFLWPPLLENGTPRVAKGVNGALVGTIRRPTGATQVTYGGHPLYTWSSDTKAGMVTGQALVNEGGIWYVVSPSGKQITKPFTVTG
ncbi:MAG: COG4315 family predicted lipoprotein [Acidimicrobiales bacterium]